MGDESNVVLCFPGGVLRQPELHESTTLRTSSVLRQLLQLTSTVVENQRFEGKQCIVTVRPAWRKPRCPSCHKPRPGYDLRKASRRWRHLNYGAMRVVLEMPVSRRVKCKPCGSISVEAVPWAEPSSGFTDDFEELVAHLAKGTDKTSVTELMGISWATVGRIIERVVARRRPADPLSGLTNIGVDEFSYRSRHRYLTTVLNHDTGEVVWSKPGSQYETLKAFFDELGPNRCAELRAVTIDMNAGFQKAIREGAPNAEIVFDRFHVQQLGSLALDQVRRAALAETRGTPEGKELFGMRFSMLRNPWNRSPDEVRKLSELERANKPVLRAVQLKDALVRALDIKDPADAKAALGRWRSWASRSGLRPFQRVGRTIGRHLGGILAYVRTRLTNGVVEGSNARLRVIARRSYGFHGPEPLMAMLFLCRGGVRLNPPLPTSV